MALAERYAPADATVPGQVSDVRHDLLQALHPDGYRDLRALRKGKEAIAFNFHSDDPANVDTFADTYGRDYNIYFGVATRADTAERDTAACVSLNALFADLDFKDSSRTKRERALRLLSPSVVMRAVTAGLLLDRPLDLQNGGAANAKQLLADCHCAAAICRSGARASCIAGR